jgi:hypothetical protein
MGTNDAQRAHFLVQSIYLTTEMLESYRYDAVLRKIPVEILSTGNRQLTT